MADNSEIQRQINELKWELRDTRINTINWWLAVNGFILAFFGIVVVIGGYLGFTRFQEIETQARQHLEEIKKMKEVGGRALEELREFTSEVIDDPKKAAQVDETLENVRQNPASSPLDLAIADASALQKQGRIGEAIEKWRAIAVVANETDNEMAARAWFSVGFLYQEKSTDGGEENALTASATAYDAAILLKPDFVQAYNNRGVAKERLGHFPEAIADYNQAISLKPDYATAYNNRGVAKERLGHFPEAIADYNQAINLKPDYAMAYNNRCHSRERLNLVEEAIADCNAAIGLKPNFPEAYNHRGNVKLRMGQLASAMADYDHAIRQRPDFAMPYRNRCLVKTKQGRFREAISECDEAIRLQPDFPEAYAIRGQAKVGLGLNGQAREDFLKALDQARKSNMEDLVNNVEGLLRNLPQ